MSARRGTSILMVGGADFNPLGPEGDRCLEVAGVAGGGCWEELYEDISQDRGLREENTLIKIFRRIIASSARLRFCLSLADVRE